MKLLRKAIYFRDVRLLLRILEMQRAIHRAEPGQIMSALGQGAPEARGAVEAMIGGPVGGKGGWLPREQAELVRERIMRYVNLGLRMGRKLGWLESCLPRSIIACRLLRERRVNACVAFGARKENGGFAGHCWVCHSGEIHDEGGFKRTWIWPEEYVA